MKIALISGGNLWFLPFIKNYTSVLDANGIDYDIISWNRDGTDPQIGIQYEKNSKLDKSKILKLFDFWGFCRFVKTVIRKNKYDKLIIFNPQVALLLKNVLKSEYKNRYIMDFRDLSVEQLPILRNMFSAILDNSWANVISSPGFIDCINGNHEFVLNHNFIPSEEIINSLNHSQDWKKDFINVLTIGGIRDFSSNSEIISSLANKTNVKISFVGKGHAAKSLEEFSEKIGCSNIEFKGYYPKEEERNYIVNTTWMNIFYPPIKSHSTALSNRFYLSIIYKRPMIVTANSIQGDYVSKYNLGLSIDNTENLYEKMLTWMNANNFEYYSARANELLKQFLNDQFEFIERLKEFCKN